MSPRRQATDDSAAGPAVRRVSGPARKTPRSDTRRDSRRTGRWLHLLRNVVLILALAPLALALIYTVVPPISTLMLGRWLTLQSVSRTWVPLERISPSLPRAVIASEDGLFCQHGGVDWAALWHVIRKSNGSPDRGASTIPMQTVKNVFLWPGRSYIRKGLEIPLAVGVDLIWSKRRMMEVYLNVAEWGEGIFGAEAAARHYFRKSAAELTPREAARLAAVLPNPIMLKAGSPSAFVGKRTAIIARRLPQQDVSCL